ncbi:MAG: amidohydrolase family protein [Gemmatimonadota bacterium]|jgi:imidazolonepropionase-like amidohydrolase
MSRSPLRRVATVVLASALGACAPDAPPPDLAIENVTVIDAARGVRENRTVVVDSGRIVRVVDAGEDVVADEVVDGAGRYLIPGLWDFHVHLTYDDRFTDAMPGLFLSHGITSIRDTGGLLEKVLPVVERMEAEGATAPRVFFAGPLLDGEHVVYDGENRPGLGIANPDVETARKNVATLAEAGVDFIKIYEMVTPEVFDALVEEAVARGLPRDGHVPLSMLASEVAPRMSSLEHLRNIEMDCASDADELLEARRRILAAHQEGPGADLRARLHAAQRLPAVAAYDPDRCGEVLASMDSTIQVPTLRLNALGLRAPWDREDWDAALERVPADVRGEWSAVAEQAREGPPARDTTFGSWSLFLVGEMYDRGVPIGAGTDTPIGFSIPGYSLHSELEMLVRAGLPPLEALRAATLRPAEFFGLDGEMGTIQEGRMADLVLLSGNPLDDIANTRGVEAVVLKGELLTRDELDALTP